MSTSGWNAIRDKGLGGLCRAVERSDVEPELSRNQFHHFGDPALIVDHQQLFGHRQLLPVKQRFIASG